MPPVLKYLQSFLPLSEDIKAVVEEMVQYRELRRKDHLLNSGQVCRNIYFVEHGLLRIYNCIGDKQISSAFSWEGQLCVVVESFFSQQVGMKSIVAMKPSAVWYITFEQYKVLTTTFPEFNVICRMLLEHCGQLREERLLSLVGHSPAERFEWIMERTPNMVQRIPGKYLSSYLGMTEAMLSNIKSRHFRNQPIKECQKSCKTSS
jgi:CRP-like cAMP-binding protein